MQATESLNHKKEGENDYARKRHSHCIVSHSCIKENEESTKIISDLVASLENIP